MFISAQSVKIDALQSLELAGVGIAITIAVLAFLMGFIYLLAFIVRKIEASGFSLASLFKKKKTVEAEASVEAHQPEKAAGAAGDVALNDVPPATAAMLMAIVADEMQTPINELKFISIKEIKE